jgi:NitT/TauT family transport system permease protein
MNAYPSATAAGERAVVVPMLLQGQSIMDGDMRETSSTQASDPPPPAVVVAPTKAQGESLMSRLSPAFGGVAFLMLWEAAVRLLHVSPFTLPAPSLVAQTMVKAFPELMQALAFTATIAITAFLLALVSGVGLGVLLAQNRHVEKMVWPYAVALQVTPMVAIAPLIVIWVGLDRAWLALLILATIVAFFPILSNAVLGMKSADHGLQNLFTLYRATRWQRFRYLQFPAALPYIVAGMRVSSGLAVIGAVVAEFVAGSGSATGLAWVIVQAGTMLDIARMFAALFVLSAFGLLMSATTGLIQHLLLGAWHESLVKQEH